MKLVVLGAPGAGKGTQAHFLALHFGVPHIATGDILRGHVKQKTPIGAAVEAILSVGGLVPDDIAMEVLRTRFADGDCEKGFILDGFPRTVYQAENAEAVTGKLDRVVLVHVDDAIIVERMSGRRICQNCGATYNLTYKPPKKADICDGCGDKLIQRVDDKAKTVRDRLRVYHEATEPIKRFYDRAGLLLTVDGTGEIDAITRHIIAQL